MSQVESYYPQSVKGLKKAYEIEYADYMVTGNHPPAYIQHKNLQYAVMIQQLIYLTFKPWWLKITTEKTLIFPEEDLGLGADKVVIAYEPGPEWNKYWIVCEYLLCSRCKRYSGLDSVCIIFELNVPGPKFDGDLELCSAIEI